MNNARSRMQVRKSVDHPAAMKPRTRVNLFDRLQARIEPENPAVENPSEGTVRAAAVPPSAEKPRKDQRSLSGIFERLLWMDLFGPITVSLITMIALVIYLGGQVFQNQQINLTTSVAYNANNYLNNATKILDTLGTRAEISDVEDMQVSMEVALQSYDVFDAFYLINQDGTLEALVPSDPDYIGLDLSRQEYFVQANNSTQTVFSNPFISMRSNSPAIYLSKSIPSGGVIAGELNLEELKRMISDRTDLGWSSEIFIIDRNGTALAHPNDDLVHQQKNLGHMKVIQQVKATKRPVSSVYVEGDQLMMGGATTIPMVGWVVVGQAEVMELLNPLIGPSLIYLLVAVATLLVFLRMFFRQFQVSVALPLSELSQVTSEITSGNYAVNQQIAHIPQTFLEISSLVKSFTNMAQSVLSREQMLGHLASHDPLTDLPNRSLFQQRLSEMIENAGKRNESFALLFIDLDDFKTVNDAFGHRIGDQALKLVANQLLSVTRTTDMVGRLGGDEFGVLLDGVRAEKSIAAAAEQILGMLCQPMYVDGHEIYLSSSIGMSIYPRDGEDPDTLVQNADTAMYHAKHEGKNGYQFFSLEMETQAQERHRLASYLHHALDKNELELYYQPLYDTKERQLKCSEALIRWRHPELGMISPAKFMPLAEETGMGIVIGEWVLRTACQQNQRWAESGFPDLAVSVNVSERQLKQKKDFVDTVRRVLRETGLPPHLLILELTENIFFQNFKEINVVLMEVKRLGVQLALDDFGTGYSTLSCLTQIPFDEIKIDRSLSRNLNTNHRDAAIVRGIIRIAKDLGMQVVAEGIEKEEQLGFFEQNQCDLLQGWYFSHAVPAGHFESKILSKSFPREDELPTAGWGSG